MSKHLLSIALALLTYTGFAQPPTTWHWAKASGGTAGCVTCGSNLRDEQATEIQSDAEGNTYVFGQFNDVNVSFDSVTATARGTSDLFLAKYDCEGNLVWFRQIGHDKREETAVRVGFAVDSIGNSYIGLSTNWWSGSPFFQKFYVGDSIMPPADYNHPRILFIKLNPAGEVSWVNIVGQTDPKADSAASAYFERSVWDPNGDLLMIGFAFPGYWNDSLYLPQKGYAVRLDTATGALKSVTEVWPNSGGPPAYLPQFWEVMADGSFMFATRHVDSFTLGGIFVDSPGNIAEQNAIIGRMSNTGDVQWVQPFRASFVTAVDAMVRRHDGGGVYVGIEGYPGEIIYGTDTFYSIYKDSVAGPTFGLICEIDSSGDLGWSMRFDPVPFGSSSAYAIVTELDLASDGTLGFGTRSIGPIRIAASNVDTVGMDTIPQPGYVFGRVNPDDDSVHNIKYIQYLGQNNFNANSLRGFSVDPFNNILVAGHFKDSIAMQPDGIVLHDVQAGKTDIFMAKFGMDTCGRLQPPPDTTDTSSIYAHRANGFILYPNPSAGQLIIRVDDAKQMIGDISIVDLIGRQHYAMPGVLSHTVQLDLSQMAKGSYIVMLRNTDGELSSMPFLLY